jgi:hypothetical protein
MAPPRSQIYLRRAVVLVCWLLIGVAGNVAVAWWAVAHQPLEQECRISEALQTTKSRVASRIEWRNPAALKWPIRVPDTWPSTPTVGTTDVGLGWTDGDWHVIVDSGSNAGTYNAILRTYGLPMRSLHCWGLLFVSQASTEQTERQSIVLPSPLPRAWNKNGFFPILPVWPGFVVNTAFYAGVAWSLRWGLLAVRRRWLRHTGRCMQCGYNLSGVVSEVCPECGAHIRAAASSIG